MLYYGIKKIDEKNDIGVIGYGEEEIILVIGDKNKWYNKVDKYKEINIVDEGVDGDDWDDWVEFVEELVDSIEWDKVKYSYKFQYIIEELLKLLKIGKTNKI